MSVPKKDGKVRICYKVMSFGLKNTRATYQRAMVALFHDMMHKEIEVYVDDMIAKSKTEGEHLVNLWKLFERLPKYQLRLNPAKCTFGVKSGKLILVGTCVRVIRDSQVGTLAFFRKPLYSCFSRQKHRFRGGLGLVLH